MNNGFEGGGMIGIVRYEQESLTKLGLSFQIVKSLLFFVAELKMASRVLQVLLFGLLVMSMECSNVFDK